MPYKDIVEQILLRQVGILGSARAVKLAKALGLVFSKAAGVSSEEKIDEGFMARLAEAILTEGGELALYGSQGLAKRLARAENLNLPGLWG